MSTSSNTRTAVQSVADSYGYGGYTGQIDAITSRIEQGRTKDSIRRDLVDYGVPSYRASDIADRLFAAVQAVEVTETAEGGTSDRDTIAAKVREIASRKRANPSAVEQVLVQSGLVVPEFDRDRAAQVLRQFASSQGVSDTETEALLVEAGLVDAPEPEVEEPQAEQSEEAPAWAQSLLRTVESLANFARRHGFNG